MTAAFGTVDAPVLGLADMRTAKRAAGRLKDRADLEELGRTATPRAGSSPIPAVHTAGAAARTASGVRGMAIRSRRWRERCAPGGR